MLLFLAFFFFFFLPTLCIEKWVKKKKKKLAKLHTYNNVAGKWNMFALKKHASPVMMKEVELPDMLLGYVLLL